VSKFIEFNPDNDTFSYHPESTPKYYLNKEYFDEIYNQVLKICDSEQKVDVLKYIKFMEMCHFTFCLGEMDSKKRRSQIYDAKSNYLKKYADVPSNCSIYELFYNKLNKGRW